MLYTYHSEPRLTCKSQRPVSAFFESAAAAFAAVSLIWKALAAAAAAAAVSELPVQLVERYNNLFQGKKSVFVRNFAKSFKTKKNFWLY